MKLRLASLYLILSTLAHAAGKNEATPSPDFTKGDAIPEKAKHDWNLGATGLRGWIFCDQMVTTDARQIAITKVEKGSPAEGVIAVGDVILANSFHTTRALSLAKLSPKRRPKRVAENCHSRAGVRERRRRSF